MIPLHVLTAAKLKEKAEDQFILQNEKLLTEIENLKKERKELLKQAEIQSTKYERLHKVQGTTEARLRKLSKEKNALYDEAVEKYRKELEELKQQNKNFIEAERKQFQEQEEKIKAIIETQETEESATQRIKQEAEERLQKLSKAKDALYDEAAEKYKKDLRMLKQEHKSLLKQKENNFENRQKHKNQVMKNS